MARLCEPGPGVDEAPSQTQPDSTPVAPAPAPVVAPGPLTETVVDSGDAASNTVGGGGAACVSKGINEVAGEVTAAGGAAGAEGTAVDTAGITACASQKNVGGGKRQEAKGCVRNGELVAEGDEDGGGGGGGGGGGSCAPEGAAQSPSNGRPAAAAAATSAPVSGVVAVAVKELSPNFPASAAGVAAPPGPTEVAKESTPPTPPAAAAGGSAAATAAAPAAVATRGPVEGGRSRRRRKNAAKAAAAAAAAAAAVAAKSNGHNNGGDGNEEEEDEGEAEVVLEGVKQGGLADGRAEDVCSEDDEGNVEYKLKLVNPPLDRLEHLFTQMNWRLNEGRGECMYMLGYEDDGKATGISPAELSASIKTLRVMMEAVGAKVARMQVQAGAGGGKMKVARVSVVRQAALFDGLPSGSERRGLRLGVLGHAGAGKSTLVSVLTRGTSDNGRGLARMQVFRHNHEVFNGQTSSISQQALTLPLGNREGPTPLGRTAPAALGGSSTTPQGAPQQQQQQQGRRRHGGGVRMGGDAGAAGAAGADAARAPASPSRLLSSSFPQSSRLGGALVASNGFASAWARKDNGTGAHGVGGGGGGNLGGGRRRGNSVDESGGSFAGRRNRRAGGNGGAVGGEEDGGGDSRVLTFIDQPGHEKYLKTTLTGMTASALDYSMLVVSGVEGVQRMTREHLAIALALQLPIFVVMTKCDVSGVLPPGTTTSCPPPPPPSSPRGMPLASSPPRRDHGRCAVPAVDANDATAPVAGTTVSTKAAASSTWAALVELDRVVWACMGRRAKIVGGMEDAEDAADALRGGSGAAGASWQHFVPVMQVSSVTSDGFEELRAFLGRLAPPEPLEAMYKEARGKATEVRISDTFMVEGVGEVYAGNVVSGAVSVGDRLLLGPTGRSGAFLRTAVASVHVARWVAKKPSALEWRVLVSISPCCFCVFCSMLFASVSVRFPGSRKSQALLSGGFRVCLALLLFCVLFDVVRVVIGSLSWIAKKPNALVWWV
ncbi:unnamed protein product [Scytosiphon promiscuus]